MLASVIHAAVPKLVAHVVKNGTSELDAPATGAKHDTSASKTRPPVMDAKMAPTNEIIRSIAALDPSLQNKLARVISRVRDETGHDVTVSETYRTQSRQDMLYAQGRDTVGPVVTWTQNSKHTQGRAVDLLLDGGAAGTDAYAALQRIAKEEGLRTLGARDPGHLELPGPRANLSDSRMTPPGIPSAVADAAGAGQVSIARLAQIAQVAELRVNAPESPARVATVAQIAQVANPTTTAKPGARRFGSDTSDRGSQRDSRGDYGALGSTVIHRDQPSMQVPVAGVATGTTGAERAARVLAAIEDAPARPLSQLTMAVDAGNGTTDRVHVALRGAVLNTTIDAADIRGAQAMSSRSDELVRALTRDGLEVESLRVRAAAVSPALPATSSSQSSSGSSTNSRFERGNPWQAQERQRSQDDRRQQQQRDERGGEDK